MSFSDDFYEELNKKKKKKQNASNNAKESGAKNKSDFSSEFHSALGDVGMPVITAASSIYDDDIAPVREYKGGNKDSWFKSGGFSDGVDSVGDFFGDLGQTIGGTAVDLALDVGKGAGRMVEGLVDLGTYGVAKAADLLGEDEFAAKAKKIARYNAVDEWTNDMHNFYDQYSVLGNKADVVGEGLGQVGAIILTGGAAGAAGLGGAGVTAVTTGVTGLSSMGTNMGEAYDSGATDKDAFLYGLSTGAIEAGTELLFGGLGKGVKALGVSRGIGGLDDIFAKKLSSKIVGSIANESVQKALGNTVEFAVKSSGEGVEEMLSGFGSAVMKKLTYEDDKTLKELVKDEKLLEQFVVGAVTSSIAQGGDFVKATKSGTDFVTGHTAADEKVINKVVEDEIARREADGKTLTAKDKNKIYDDVVERMEKGQIDIDTIDSMFGGDSYTAYRDAVDGLFNGDTYKDYKKALEEEQALTKEIEELGKKEGATPADNFRYTELMQKQKDSSTAQAERKAQIEAEAQRIIEMRSNLRNEIVKKLGNNSKLLESYREEERSHQKFKADLTQYKNEHARKTIQSIMDSGLMSDTRESHELADWLAQIASDKGVVVSLTDKKALIGTRFEHKGRTTNAYFNEETGDVVLNIDSEKPLNSSVGHELGHVLKGIDANLYEEFKANFKAWANSKNGEWDARYKTASEAYAKRDADGNIIRDADGNIVFINNSVNIDDEVTNDLIGDYIFTDKDFIKHLSVKQPNVFKHWWDEIKYMVKVAKAGTKVEKELLALEKQFAEIWRETGKFQPKTNEAAQRAQNTEQNIAPDAQNAEDVETDTVQFSIREEAPPKETGIAYKVFFVKDGKLYPPMVANPDGADTPMGVWLNADVGTAAPPSKTGRAQVKAGGKGTQGGGGSLAFRPGWHLGDLPRASQFDRVNPETGKKELFPENFVWAEVEYAKDVDYQEEAMSYGYTENGKFRHAYAGLPRLPENGYYRYRTNPKPDTVPWVITGAMKVNRLLSDAEVNEILEKNGVPAVHRQGGDVGLDKFGFGENGQVQYSASSDDIAPTAEADGVVYSLGDNSLDKYTKTQYNNFGWARHAEAITKNELDDLYSKVQEKGSLKRFAQTSRGEAIVEVNDNHRTTLGVNNVFVFVTGTKNSPQITRVVRFDAETETEMEIFKEKLYERGTFSDTYCSFFRENGIAREYSKNRSIAYHEYIQKVRRGSGGTESDRIDGNSGLIGNGAGTFAETEANGITSEKKASSDDGVFFDGEKTNYSLSSDSEGNNLSAEQSEYFADSKIRDENGNLKVMYHGTPNGDFSIFKDGTYFTENEWYADLYQNPGASSLNSRKVASNPKTFKVYLDIKKPFDIADAEARSIYINDYIKGGNAVGINPYLSDAEYEKISSIDWTEGEDLRDFLIDSGYDYDGLVLDEGAVGGYGDDVKYRGKSYVIFSPEQVKDVDNKNPTSDPDIHFSISNAVEETRDLMALHNMQASELLKTLELGGLPMPSIAVIKAEMGHEQYGDVSLILPKEAIDPQTNKDNKVYGGDAWTPTYPRIEYKPNEKVAKKISDKYYELARVIGYDGVRPMYRYVNELEDALNRDGGEAAMLEKLYEDTGMMNVYLQDSGKGKVETITKETVTKISDGVAEMNQYFIDALGEDFVASYKAPDGVNGIEYRSEFMKQHEEKIRDAYKRYFMEIHGFTAEEVENVFENITKRDLTKIMRDAYMYTLDKGVTVRTETDHAATEDAIRAKAADGYKEWVDGLFKGIEEKSGIRNNQDYYTRSGNPRSWDALHWENTLENVVKVMKEQDDTGVGSFSPFNTLFGASHKRYDSIQDIKADSGRLGKINQDEYDAMKDSFSERFAEIAHSIKDPDERNSFIATDTAAEQIIEAVRTKKTKEGILKHLKALNSRATMQTVDDILSLVSDIANMPTGYFEAKPKRAVSLDEVGVFVIPRNADVKLKQELLNRGYSIAEYDPDVEGDRQRVVNRFEEYKFSLSDATKQPTTNYGDYAVYGKDVKYTPLGGDIAPVGESVTTKTAKTPDGYVPVTEEEADALSKARFETITDADAPPEMYRDYDSMPDTTAIDDKTLKNIGKSLRETLSLTPQETKAIQEIVQEYSTSETPNTDSLFETIKAKFGEKVWKIKHDEIADVKRILRTTKIKVSPKIKSDIADYGDFRKKSIGGKLSITGDGLPVDTVYKELVELYPAFFSDDIWNETDQFLRMVEVANLDAYEYDSYQLDDATIQEAVNIISREVGSYKQNLTRMAAEKAARDALDSVAPAKATQIMDGSREDALLVQSLDNFPIKTVEDRLKEKLRAVEAELADKKQLRREKWHDYESRIADLRAEYAGLKNKSTKKADEIVNRVSRLERLKASDDADYAKRISDLEARIEKMSDPKYARAMQKQAKMEADAKWAADLLGDTSTWVDKKLGLQYATNTERRNLRDIVRDADGNADIAKADAIDDALNGQYNRDEAAKKRELAKVRDKYAKLKITRAEDAYIQMLGEFRHNPDTTLTEKDISEYYEKHKSKIDTAKVDRVIEMARQDYDNFLNRVNAELKKQGMKEIPYRQGYFPHFTEPKQNFIQKLLNWKTQDNEIPTSIAGLTETFKPTKSWQSFDKTRHSDETDYSFMKGFDSYSEGALDWIYHMDTLQKRRAVENHIRFTHSDEGIQAKIREVYADKEMDANEAQARIEQILTEAENPLNNFVQDFTTHTNILAGKKNSLDRTVEQWTNRHIYSVMTNVQNRMSANMVLANVRSALTNFIPITQSWAQVSPVRSLQAAKETIANAFKDDGTVGKSTFLTNRLREADKLYQTGWDRVLDKAGIMFEVVDSFSSQVIWRSKYNQNIADGMSESEAIRNADQFAENVMAGRSKGNEPTLFNAKNPFVKAFTMFQLEVNNQYGYLFKDVPNDLKAETNHWKINLAKGYTTAFIGAYVYNALLEKVTGSDAALDPIGIIEELLRDLGLLGDDEEEEPTKVATNLIGNVAEELPFVGGLLGGGRIPISSAIPYSGEGFMGGLEAFAEDVGNIGNGGLKNIGEEMMNPLLNVGLPVAGGQIKKTAQGLGMFSDDHPVSGSYTGSGNLRFPVEDTPLNRVQAALFGQYASKNAREYFDNDYAPLNEKQIQEYIDVDMPIKDYWEYRKGLKGKTKAEEQMDYISGLDIPTYKKNILANNVLDRKEPVDLENYEDFGSLDEFDFATKNPEKYAFAKSVGGYSAYKAYSSELYNIKADKDASGKSINGSRKEKVIDYINNLDADYYTKIILHKSEYPSDDSYNGEIVNYINNRSDLTYEDRVAILTELGFRVTADGQIYDD